MTDEENNRGNRPDLPPGMMPVGGFEIIFGPNGPEFIDVATGKKVPRPEGMPPLEEMFEAGEIGSGVKAIPFTSSMRSSMGLLDAVLSSDLFYDVGQPGEEDPNDFLSASNFGQAFTSFMSTMLGSMPGARKEPEFDFGRACFGYDVYQEMPGRVNKRLHRLRELEKEKGSGAIVKKVRPIRSEIARLLRSETALQFQEEQIIPYHNMTRAALDYLFTKIAGDDKIAMPLPNWHFWSMKPCPCMRPRYKMAEFDARDEDQLVEGFRRVAENDDKVRGLILTSPSNPLMYAITPECAAQIDEIALKHGIEIIVDDVMRGNQPLGNRGSIAEDFSRPYVVEGFSKRFGFFEKREGDTARLCDLQLGELSYILVPEDDRCELAFGEEKSALYGEALRAAIKYSDWSINNIFRARNFKFSRIMADIFPEAEVIRPSDTSMVSLLELPADFDLNCSSVDSYLEDEYGIKVRAMNAFYPGHKPEGYGDNLFRVSVGNIYGKTLEEGAAMLGVILKALYEGKDGLRR